MPGSNRASPKGSNTSTRDASKASSRSCASHRAAEYDSKARCEWVIAAFLDLSCAPELLYARPLLQSGARTMLGGSRHVTSIRAPEDSLGARRSSLKLPAATQR